MSQPADARAAALAAADESALTPEQALEIALKLEQSGRPDLAGTIYERILAAAPDYADGHHFYGGFLHRQGYSGAGIEHIRRAIALLPDVGIMHNNLGNIFMELKRLDLALQAYEVAVDLDPGHADARNNLGVALAASGRVEEAEAAYHGAIAADPKSREAWDNLGRLLSATGRVKEAVAAHAEAFRLEPKNADSRRVLALALAATDQREEAVRIIRDWLADEPGSATARHLLAAISGESVPERASDVYVQDLFDRFATNFDRQLAMLDYRAPAHVGDAVASLHGEAQKRLEVLDAGCGTGLCAPFLTPYAQRLVGIDLSAKMLKEAEPRGYDALEQAELTQYLLDHPEGFDLVVSADTLCYFGALEAPLAAAARALRSTGHLVFTVEEETAGRGVHLNTHGRYSHSLAHVEAALRAAGLDILGTDRVKLRQERGEAVIGLLVVGRKG